MCVCLFCSVVCLSVFLLVCWNGLFAFWGVCVRACVCWSRCELVCVFVSFPLFVVLVCLFVWCLCLCCVVVRPFVV